MSDIGNFLKRQLEILSDHKSLRLAARNRAVKLLENLQETLTKRKEILNFIESQDLKFAEDRYKVNVELSVVTDKTAITGKTSEKFARSLNNDQDIRDSENQDSRTETQTTVNNEQEENEGEYVAADESMTICVKDILEGSIEVSSVVNEVTEIFLNKFPKTVARNFDEIDSYITDDIHEFLTKFFNEDLTARGWGNAINNMDFNAHESELLKNTKKLIQETLPKFLKAFSLEGSNPLRDITFLEKPHLNQFWRNTFEDLGLKIRTDGVGFLNDVVNYPIVCGEGARPGASQKKCFDNDIKNAGSMAALYINIVIEEADVRRRLFTDLRVYGLTAFKTELSLTVMDFRSVHRLFEVDHFGLPKDWVDMPNFVWLYEAVVKWPNELIEHRKKRRVSRYSEISIAKKLAPLRGQYELS
ncbi:3244_t:CDS:2 [Funneliformis mosseae]|uniref:3244_t:CDS:1 n=1 Tax=Funneliformis mosseae TaxID=27381 RepID=A0A9N9H2L5_FUNMO|nr:3244_t:CDS:2 [Funneliformis mosseae]